MICQRCGKCCCGFFIGVIHPDFVKEHLNIDKLPKEAFLGLSSGPCPHLSWDGNIAICKIHHYEWYKQTPCYSHGQVESCKDDPCRTGIWMRENKINVRNTFCKK